MPEKTSSERVAARSNSEAFIPPSRRNAAREVISTSDDVAREWVIRACGRLARSDDDLQPVDRELWRVACARARGASPDRIVSALRAQHRGRPRYQPTHNDQEVCYPFQDLASLALIRPPFAPRP